jgi:hypothetical protein
MEQEAIQPKEVYEARSRYRVEMAKTWKLIDEMSDPEMWEELAETPPHLLGR